MRGEDAGETLHYLASPQYAHAFLLLSGWLATILAAPLVFEGVPEAIGGAIGVGGAAGGGIALAPQAAPLEGEAEPFLLPGPPNM
jgi:hypothetical protein